MNEERAKVLLKKSALKTTEHFTDSLMEQIKAKSADQVQTNFPSINRFVLIIVVLVVFISFLLFFTDFENISEIKFIGNAYHRKLFVVFLLSVLLGVNHLLKLEQALKSHLDE